MSTWVVAADSSRARILSAEKRAGQLVELEAMVHPEARLHGQELLSDAPGAAFDSGALGRHAIGGRVDVKQQEAIRFAKRLCDRIALAHSQGNFERLYIVASPNFLGLLREGMHPPVQNAIAGEIGKNLANHSLEEIRRHLPDYL